MQGEVDLNSMMPIWGELATGVLLAKPLPHLGTAGTWVDLYL